ncbi:MBL fold metallo-hydrolase [Pseudonocardia sp. RS010]|uniref:MBL fold metallo-hydrolase n=1 Tax=Pseudonocardia sp. RS010 TaxID=3385979 RepID=UPI0039A33254
MIEIDFLRVGEESNSGDAITGRLTRPDTGDYAVFVVDGGFESVGHEIVEFVQTRYNTDVVDLVISTHPDQDHISGLYVVVEELRVAELLLHRPSLYGYTDSDEVKAAEADKLAALARSFGTIVTSPFARQTYLGGALTIAGPTEDFYREQLAEQASTRSKIELAVRKYAHKAAEAIRASLTPIFGEPPETLLTDHGGTTPRNNMSVVTEIQVDDNRILLTGDAGVPALNGAMETLDLIRVYPSDFDVVQMPHHGSRHNVDRDTLDRLLGQKTTIRRGSAVASVAAKADDYPRAEVANAFKRRGYPVFRTAGSNFWWQRGAPARSDYSPATELPWLEENEN